MDDDAKLLRVYVLLLLVLVGLIVLELFFPGYLTNSPKFAVGCAAFLLSIATIGIIVGQRFIPALRSQKSS